MAEKVISGGQVGQSSRPAGSESQRSSSSGWCCPLPAALFPGLCKAATSVERGRRCPVVVWQFARGNAVVAALQVLRRVNSPARS